MTKEKPAEIDQDRAQWIKAWIGSYSGRKGIYLRLRSKEGRLLDVSVARRSADRKVQQAIANLGLGEVRECMIFGKTLAHRFVLTDLRNCH